MQASSARSPRREDGLKQGSADDHRAAKGDLVTPYPPVPYNWCRTGPILFCNQRRQTGPRGSPPRSLGAASPTTPLPYRGPDEIRPLAGPAGALFPPAGRDRPGANGGSATGLPEPRAPNGPTRGGPPLAHDAGGEGGADAVPLERQTADHRRPGPFRPHPCAEVVPGGDRPDRAPERRPRGACARRSSPTRSSDG